MEVQGRRKRGRPERRCLDKVRDDIKEKGLLEVGSVRPCYMEAYVFVHRPQIKVGKDEEEEDYTTESPAKRPFSRSKSNDSCCHFEAASRCCSMYSCAESRSFSKRST